jgi:hypothetical protein
MAHRPQPSHSRSSSETACARRRAHTHGAVSDGVSHLISAARQPVARGFIRSCMPTSTSEAARSEAYALQRNRTPAQSHCARAGASAASSGAAWRRHERPIGRSGGDAAQGAPLAFGTSFANSLFENICGMGGVRGASARG